jgi:hypothetical protein
MESKEQQIKTLADTIIKREIDCKSFNVKCIENGGCYVCLAQFLYDNGYRKYNINALEEIDKRDKRIKELQNTCNQWERLSKELQTDRN